MSTVVEARKIGDSFVALGDIVNIKLDRSSSLPDPLYRKVGSKRLITGRIVSFEEYCVVLDTSERFHYQQFDIAYTVIEDIQQVKDGELET